MTDIPLNEWLETVATIIFLIFAGIFIVFTEVMRRRSQKKMQEERQKFDEAIKRMVQAGQQNNDRE